jgi:hypothetical protein
MREAEQLAFTFASDGSSAPAEAVRRFMNISGAYREGDRMKAATAGRLLGALRVGLGTAHVIAPAPVSIPLVGGDARRPAAQAFIEAFGVRDAALGLGTASAHTNEDLRRWLLTAAVIDMMDTVAVLRHFHELPERRRWAALMAPGIPAILGAVLIAAIGRDMAEKE